MLAPPGFSSVNAGKVLRHSTLHVVGSIRARMRSSTGHGSQCGWRWKLWNVEALGSQLGQLLLAFLASPLDSGQEIHSLLFLFSYCHVIASIGSRVHFKRT